MPAVLPAVPAVHDSDLLRRQNAGREKDGRSVLASAEHAHADREVARRVSLAPGLRQAAARWVVQSRGITRPSTARLTRSSCLRDGRVGGSCWRSQPGVVEWQGDLQGGAGRGQAVELKVAAEGFSAVFEADQA